MSPLLRVLVLIDTIADFDLLARELRRTGFELALRRVTTEAAYMAELESPLDLILADNALPEFDAMRALQILRASALDIPLIVVTESADEEAAIECVSLGAADFLFKDRPARLGTAVVRAMDQRELRAHARASDVALRKSAAINQAVLDSLTAHIAVLNAAGGIVAVNQAWKRFARANGDPSLMHTCVGINYLEICRKVAGDNSAESWQVTHGIAAVLARKLDQFAIEYPCHSPSEERWFLMRVTPLVGEHTGAVVAHENITERRKADATRALLASIVDSSDDAIIGVAPDSTVMSWNIGAEHLYGYRADQMIGRPIAILRPPHLQDEDVQVYDRLARGESTAHIETVRVRNDGQLIDVALTISAINDASGRVSGFSTIARDISERKHGDQALRQKTAFIQLFQEVAVAANQATSLDQALQTAVDRICRHIGWPVGHVYLPDPEVPGALVPTDIWHLEDTQRFATFRKITEVVRLAPGIGQPGQAMASGKPAWIADMILDVNTPRTRLIRDIGVRAGFALPVLFGDEVAAVLEFFATEAIEPDEALLDVLHHVGTQLGRVVERVRAEAALRSAEAQYRTLVEQIPAIIYMAEIDERSSTYYVSPQIETILGFSPEEWLVDPQFWLTQVHPDDRALVLAAVHRSHASEDPIPVEYRSYTRDGRVVWLLDAVQMVRDEGGQPLFLQGIMQDITERKRAEDALHASERLYRTLASNFPNGAVVLFDHDLRFTIADGAGLADLGLTRERAEGHTIWEVFTPDECATIEPIYRMALAGMPNVREIVLGDHAYVIHTLPVRDERGEIIAGMEMSQDITDRKRIEEALIEERALLARRVDERTADLSAANAELARTAMLKDEFLASMSHELRTPLNAVLGLSEALQEEVYGPLNDRQRRSLHSIEESGRHLLELINDILDLAKIGAGKLELDLEPTSIETICQASLRLIKQIAHKKRLSVDLTIDPAVTVLNVDARRMKQILVNLLSNAVKFTPEGGAIGLEVSGDAARQAVDLTVWDTGIGIAQEQMTWLFQPFVQLDSRLARQYQGTGLGLALVYRMVEMHGGSIAVTSEVGRGSRFTVALPWYTANAAAQASAPAAPETVAFDRTTIRRALVVEDSPTTADQITRYLHELEIESATVGNGAEVVALAIAARPDLILLDLLLPDISGWDVLALLKAEPRTRAIPVLIISVIDERSRGLALGAAEYLVKPVARADLQHVLPALTPTLREYGIPQAPGAASTPARATPPPLVLLAEDNEANITMISDYLGARGYQVVVARNGAEAIARAREARPAIVLMDIQMPGMDGLEATRRIRTIDALVDLPIIALTALAMPGDRERCLAAGANDYLSKPVSPRGLAILIENNLRQHSSQQRSHL